MVEPTFSNVIYSPDQCEEWLYSVRKNFRIIRSKNIRYFNVPASFDTETTSFYEGDEKRACMYVWALCLYGAVMIGRTWTEFINTVEYLRKELDLSPDDKRLIIFVRNLGFDFQFFRKWLEWESVFAIDTRRPLYAVSTLGIEFRCSYLLSGLSLQKSGENLHTLHMRKMIGDLDYNLVRHSATPLTKKEIGYVSNDVRVDVAYIWETMEECGNIGKMPLTNTGFVRNYCRDMCFAGLPTAKENKVKRARYRDDIKQMTLSAKSYESVHRAFIGGFTHANVHYFGDIVKDVTSFDFTSSYPTVMIAELFPMSAPEEIDLHNMNKKDFEKLMQNYCLVFDLELFGVESRVTYENYLSVSHCRNMRKHSYKANNGRLVEADHLVTTVTDVDYKIIAKFYKWKKARVFRAYRFAKGYLPTDFVKSIVQLYKDKTELKGIEGKEAEYMRKKGMCNAAFGMTVTNIVREPITYINNLWSDEGERKKEKKPELNIDEIIEKYNNDKARFLYYVWGIFVCAFARRNLFLGICEFGNDYIYSDTDSIKVINAEKHMNFINTYNDMITKRLQAACEYHGIPLEDIKPKNKKGVECPLGVWSFDGHYALFKTLGAKRYLVMYSNDKRNDHPYKLTLTVAGLGKKTGGDYLQNTYGKYGAFLAFKEGLHIPPEHTGKQTHTYIDTEQSGLITDYLGNLGTYHEKSSVHLAPVDYYLSVSEEYRNYLKELWEYEY